MKKQYQLMHAYFVHIFCTYVYIHTDRLTGRQTYIDTYITLHYITLRYVTLHYLTLHYIALHYSTLHYITLHYIALHYKHYIALHHYIA